MKKYKFINSNSIDSSPMSSEIVRGNNSLPKNNGHIWGRPIDNFNFNKSQSIQERIIDSSSASITTTRNIQSDSHILQHTEYGAHGEILSNYNRSLEENWMINWNLLQRFSAINGDRENPFDIDLDSSIYLTDNLIAINNSFMVIQATEPHNMDIVRKTQNYRDAVNHTLNELESQLSLVRSCPSEGFIGDI